MQNTRQVWVIRVANADEVRSLIRPVCEGESLVGFDEKVVGRCVLIPPFPPLQQPSQIRIIESVATSHVEPGSFEPETLENILKVLIPRNSIVGAFPQHHRTGTLPVTVNVEDSGPLASDYLEELVVFLPRDWR